MLEFQLTFSYSLVIRFKNTLNTHTHIKFSTLLVSESKILNNCIECVIQRKAVKRNVNWLQEIF